MTTPRFYKNEEGIWLYKDGDTHSSVRLCEPEEVEEMMQAMCDFLVAEDFGE